MKAISMAKRFASILALLLAIMMLFAACGPDEQTSSQDDTAQETSSEDITEETPSEGEDPTETSSKTPEGDNNSKQDDGNKPTSSGDKKPGKQNGFDNSKEANIYKNVPKGEVHVLMWRKYHKSEQLLIDQYSKLTGVKVKTTVTTEQEYPTKLVSMVSGGNSPDVICFSAGNFPGLVTKSLQALKTQYFQLDSDCWNKNYMDAYKINGVYFGVAQPSSWSCEDCTYVTYYSPKVLQQCGVSPDAMPYKLYTQGKWNWETQAEIVRKAKNKNLTGLALQSNDMFMLSAGVDFAKYDGSKYTNQLGKVGNTSLLTSAWMEVAELKGDNCLAGWDLNNVQQGKVALFTAISYGLYNEGNWFTSSFAKNLEAVPVAGPKGGTAYTPVRPKCWGVPKKAKNPEGAAYFLRYFLDTSEFDQSSTFHNKQFETVYKKITSKDAKKTVMHGWGVSDYVESGTYSKICNALTATTPSNITTQLNAKKGSVQTGIARANKDLARIK